MPKTYADAVANVRNFRAQRVLPEEMHERLHKAARGETANLLRNLPWDDLVLLSQVNWAAALEARGAELHSAAQAVQDRIVWDAESAAEGNS